MDQQILSLEKALKRREFGDLQGVVKTAFTSLLGIVKATRDKLTTHYDLYYDIVSKTEEHHIAIEKELTRIKGADNFEESLIDPRSFLKKEAGLDRVMIEEVKTLAEALIERRMEEARGENLSKQEFCVEMKLLEEELEAVKERVDAVGRKKVGNEEFEFKLKEQRIQLYEELTKSTLKSAMTMCPSEGQLSARDNNKISRVENDIESIKYSMRNGNTADSLRLFEEVRLGLDRKLDKKEFTDLKSKVNKEISNKLGSQEVEAILSQFQQRIFDRLNEVSSYTKLVQTTLVSKVKTELQVYQQETTSKQKRVKQIQKQIEKVERRVQSEIKMRREVGGEEYNHLIECHEGLRQEMGAFEQEIKDQLSTLLEMFSSHIQDSSKSTQTFNLSVQSKPVSSFKIASCGVFTKNLLVPWEEEEYNLHKQNYLFQQYKTSVCVVCPGLYWLKVCVSGHKRVEAEVVLNGEYAIRLSSPDSEWTQKEGRVLYYTGVIILPQKAKLNLKLSDEAKVDAVLTLNKML